jgi:hypothetical protein
VAAISNVNSGEDVMPSVEQFYRALSSLEAKSKLTDQHRKMLRFHLAQPILTATRMAELMEQHDYKWSNLHYGALAKLICDELEASQVKLKYERNFDGSNMWTSVIAEIVPGTSKTDVEMLLRDEVAEALRRMPGFCEAQRSRMN